MLSRFKLRVCRQQECCTICFDVQSKLSSSFSTVYVVTMSGMMNHMLALILQQARYSCAHSQLYTVSSTKKVHHRSVESLRCQSDESYCDIVFINEPSPHSLLTTTGRSRPCTQLNLIYSNCYTTVIVVKMSRMERFMCWFQRPDSQQSN